MADRPPISIRGFRNQMSGDIEAHKAEARADCIAELRAALPEYEEAWGMYACHFEDAIKVLEQGPEAWKS